MASLENGHSTDILKRMAFNDKYDWKVSKASHKNTHKGLRAAIAKGNLFPQRATVNWASRLSSPKAYESYTLITGIKR